ncbi:MAG TPA: hypothetical protein VFU19_10435 [Iamia sp.]|nr:hypothetical protein [Iamia sp.]
MVGRDWVAWHGAYGEEGHPLRDRLAAVVDLVATAVAAAPPGPVRVASLCAGDGRDLATALADHPRRADVVAHLVELDPTLAAAARRRLATAGVAGEVVTGDAGHSGVLAGVVPVDVLLLVGIFGNVPDADVERTIAAVPSLCRTGATVLWTRHRRAPDLTPAIRRWFDAAGCTRLALRTGDGEGRRAWTAGAEQVGAVAPFAPGPLFRFEA